MSHTGKIIVAIDTETDLIGPGNVIPSLVCASFASRNAQGEIETQLISHCEDDLEHLLRMLLTSPDAYLVFLNTGFDLGVICRWRPSLIPLVFAKLASCEQITDIGIREKLRNLSTTGMLKQRELPDGTFVHVEYSLAALAERHLGEDLSAIKSGDEDQWRTNFHSLTGKSAADYPDEAREYAIGDAVRTLRIFEMQEAEIAFGSHSVVGEHFKTALQVALRLISARGMVVDPVERARLVKWIESELDDSKHRLLIENGILKPATTSRPVLTQAKRLAEFFGCSVAEAKAAITERPWTADEVAIVQAAGISVTAAKASSIDRGKLGAYVETCCAKHDVKLRRTEPSTTYPEGQISTDEQTIKALSGIDATMAEYAHRQSLQQIANKELPAMEAPIVHFNYDECVESLRTSSYGGGKKKLYPATNGQNVNPEVRRAYVARPGMVLCSIDFDRLELCTLAQKCFELFGASVMRDKINAGVDLHSYLGARICAALDPEFQQATLPFATDGDKLYAAFMAMKKSEHEGLRAKYDNNRKLAKPTGLGFPGGLGVEKFVRYAASKKYSVNISVGTAQVLRDVWFDTFPEMRPYFSYINEQCEDTANSGRMDEETGRPIRRYCYTSPLGTYRAGCSFTEAANGLGLQTFAADGFGIAIFNVVRACFDPEFGSPLYGAHVVNEIHDELLLEFEWDGQEDLARARAADAASLMLGSMAQVVKDVKLGAEPALMRRWDKRAEPVYDEQGRLQVWTPKEVAA